MLNAMAWALACFGVVAADIALSVVLFSVLDAVSVLTGFPIDNLDIQWFQAAAQTASFLMALLWWRYLWPRSFMARRQGERPRHRIEHANLLKTRHLGTFLNCRLKRNVPKCRQFGTVIVDENRAQRQKPRSARCRTGRCRSD